MSTTPGTPVTPPTMSTNYTTTNDLSVEPLTQPIFGSTNAYQDDIENYAFQYPLQYPPISSDFGASNMLHNLRNLAGIPGSAFLTPLSPNTNAALIHVATTPLVPLNDPPTYVFSTITTVNTNPPHNQPFKAKKRL